MQGREFNTLDNYLILIKWLLAVVHNPFRSAMEGSSSVCEAALLARPQLFELHLTAQVSEGRFEHIPEVSVGLQRLSYQRLGTHRQDGLAEVFHATHQVPQQHTRLSLLGGNQGDIRVVWCQAEGLKGNALDYGCSYSTCTLTTSGCVLIHWTAARVPPFSMMTVQFLGLRKARTERQALPCSHTYHGES